MRLTHWQEDENDDRENAEETPAAGPERAPATRTRHPRDGDTVKSPWFEQAGARS